MNQSFMLLPLLLAASTPINKYLLTMTSPLVLACTRMLCAGSLLLLGSVFFQKKLPAWNKHHVPLFGQKLSTSYLKYAFKYWGLHYMPATKMAFLLHTTPFFTAVLSAWKHNERLAMRQWAAIGIGFVSMMPLLMVQDSIAMSLSTFFMIGLPELAIIVAVIAHSYGITLTKQLVHTYHYPASVVSGVSALGGGLLSLCHALYSEQPLYIEHIQIFIPWFLLLILMSNIIGHTWYIHLLKRASPTLLALTDYLNPLCVAVYSYLFLGEAITWHYGVSAFFIMIALLLFKDKSLSQPHT